MRHCTPASSSAGRAQPWTCSWLPWTLTCAVQGHDLEANRSPSILRSQRSTGTIIHHDTKLGREPLRKAGERALPIFHAEAGAAAEQHLLACVVAAFSRTRRQRRSQISISIYHPHSHSLAVEASVAILRLLAFSSLAFCPFMDGFD